MTQSEGVAPRTVSRFEANLLEILRFLLRGEPFSPAPTDPLARDSTAGYSRRHIGHLIFAQCPPPRCLSRAAVELVQDSLAKGCTLWLARSSGWWRERHLRDGRIVAGRLWERSQPQELRLTFSHHTLEFLIWITAENPAEKKTRWPGPPLEELTFGDWLFFFRVYGVLRNTEAGTALRSRELFAAHPLCRLAYPDYSGPHEGVPLDFLPWTNGVGACILEALQLELARHWIQVEREKGKVADWRRMVEIGRAQEHALDAFFRAVETASRLDLARFVLAALSEVLPPEAQVPWWTGGVNPLAPRLADRAETSRAALALVRQTERLDRWTRQARGVAFFEDNYAASQLWKADWEHWQGDALRTRAQALQREVEPLTPREG